jgi:3-oxoacyl-[acyl-carrier-protein] synthase II
VSVASLRPARTPALAAQVAIAGGAVHIPGVATPSERLLAGIAGEGVVPAEPLQAGIAGEDAVPAERASELLGRKGLLAKDEATRLALCAVHRALGRPPRAPKPDGPPDPRTAVVACSNLGNFEAVTRIARAAREGGVRAVSAMDAPNASSNIVASTVAIWFRFGGPNLMVCSGATAGLDGIWLGSLLLRAGRADRVVVVGSEPAAQAPRKTIAGAAAIVLEAAGAGARATRVGRPRFTPPGAAVAPAARLVIAAGRPPGLDGDVIDLDAELGDLYGAAGVVAVALAADVAARTGAPVAVVCGDPDDGWQTLTIGDPEEAGA